MPCAHADTRFCHLGFSQNGGMLPGRGSNTTLLPCKLGCTISMPGSGIVCQAVERLHDPEIMHQMHTDGNCHWQSFSSKCVMGLAVLLG